MDNGVNSNEFVLHNHNGVNTTKLNIFNIIPTTSTVPAYNSQEGDVVFYSSGGTYKIYVYLNSGWRSATLT